MGSILTNREDNVWKDKGLLRMGLWRAKVLNNVDSQGRGRVQIRVFHLHPEPLPPSGALTKPNQGSSRPADAIAGPGEIVNRTSQQGVPDNLCPWAEPAFPFGGKTGSDSGFFMLPEVGSTVWVGFEMGFVGRPVWFGSWLGSGEVPSEASSSPQYVRIIKTPTGSKLVFDDTPSAEQVILESASGHQLLMDDTPTTQKIKVETTGGSSILMDDIANLIDIKTLAGHEVRIDETASTITIQLAGGTASLVLTPTSATLTSGGNTIAVTSAGNATITSTGLMTINSSGIVSLGVGAVKGVALDSLLTILNTFIGVFNAHTHVYSPGPGAPTPTAGPSAPGVPGVPGVETSVTVLARA